MRKGRPENGSNSGEFELEVKPSDTVDEVRQKICDQEGFSVEDETVAKCDFIFAGKSFGARGESLNDSNIRDGSKLLMSLRPVGWKLDMRLELRVELFNRDNERCVTTTERWAGKPDTPVTEVEALFSRKYVLDGENVILQKLQVDKVTHKEDCGEGPIGRFVEAKLPFLLKLEVDGGNTGDKPATFPRRGRKMRRERTSPGKLRVLIVGAGPSGLVAAKECLEHGLEPIVCEKSFAVGGVWAHGVWPTMRTNLR